MTSPRDQRVVVVGAGIGGLSAAIALACRGTAVTVLERSTVPGGKMRQLAVAGRGIDAGPTVFTMRWVFEELLANAGASLAGEVVLRPSHVLARHAWSETERLDLHADIDRSAEAIAAFSGPGEAKAYRAFIARAAEAYRTLETPFLRASRPNLLSMTARIGLHRMGALLRLEPFSTLAATLSRQFSDPRLRQLYGRYATYVGSSPYLCPATMMLIAHVEQDGVWFVEGGMIELARALARVAERLGVEIFCDTPVERIETASGRVQAVRTAREERLPCAAVVVNADASAVGMGLLGPDIAAAVAPVAPQDRSLSAMAFAMVAKSAGFPLLHHNVFFPPDYAAEFDAIFRRRQLPADPTVYLCAQDRSDGDRDLQAPERMLLLVNAPATGDVDPFPPAAIDACRASIARRLAGCGLHLDPEATAVASPADFARLFPGTGGALYGRANHGWNASFKRPDARTAIPGLYLAGGSVHPGAGVPMAALSGRLAAASVLSDLASTSPSRRAATAGGMSTP